MRPQSGLLKVIEFMNGWGRELDRIKDLLVVRYEDLRADTEGVLTRILDFMGTPGSTEQVREAVSFASVENMRRLEQKRVFWLSGRRMLAKDRNNLDTYKVRRAKVGGYRDDFTPEQLDSIDALVNTRLLPVFNYARSNVQADLATVAT
jgi:Sulfotransferase domain